MKLKGEMVIELTDTNTGAVETVRETNMITEAVNNILGLNPMGIYLKASGEYDNSVLWNGTLLPICPNMIGGILLFPAVLEEKADHIYEQGKNLPVAYASNNVNSGSNVARGSLNQTESKKLDNGYKFVWEFTPSQDILWYIWAGPNSPLYGKDKMTTFERYFIADKETHREKKNAYYHLWENEEVVNRMLEEFGLDPENGHIINGHVPVHQLEGENPVKCGGKVIVIDGGFCEAYRNVTGIAGYTLVYSSYGLSLTAHEPFTSAEDAVETERDIVSNRVAVRYNPRRALVGDTDNGKALKERIQELKQLLDAYRKGVIKEKK